MSKSGCRIDILRTKARKLLRSDRAFCIDKGVWELLFLKRLLWWLGYASFTLRFQMISWNTAYMKYNPIVTNVIFAQNPLFR